MAIANILPCHVVIITVFDVIEVKNIENNSPHYLRVLHLIAYHRPTSCNLRAQAVIVSYSYILVHCNYCMMTSSNR